MTVRIFRSRGPAKHLRQSDDHKRGQLNQYMNSVRGPSVRCRTFKRVIVTGPGAVNERLNDGRVGHGNGHDEEAQCDAVDGTEADFAPIEERV